MPEDTEQQDSTQNSDKNDTNQNNVQTQNKTIVLGCDSNGVNDSQCQQTVADALQHAGYTVENLGIAPGPFADYSYSDKAKGKIGVYLMAASLVSFLDAGAANFDYNVFGIRGDVSDWGKEDGFNTKGVPKDHHGDCTMPECDKYQGKTYPELNEIYKGKCVAVPGETPEILAQNIIAALGGEYNGTNGAVVSSNGGAQIKDKTFEKCIRRICAATDSIFLVENNAAVLFPYIDWMAFTLRQKISTIKKNEIDPKVFSMEYGNDGFYNKVSIAWGGATLPERFPDKKSSKKQVHKDKVANTNYTVDDILSSMEQNNFKISKLSNTKQDNKTTTKNKKDKTTQEISVDENGVTLLSEQYDKFVEIYGEQEKRVQSSAPDLETAQYIVNALLIQYIRDYNYSCRCRALNNRKYIGGTFYAVQNPFNNDTELFYLNGYTMRTQKREPMYYDLDFKYGPEGAEEILDYQTLSGGAASGGATSNTNSGGTASEENIWKDAAKCKWAQDQEDCSTQDPATAKKHYDDYSAQGKEVHFDCYGMSAYLYYRFNNEANIPCQVVGDSSHHVVMLDRGKGFESTRDDYRNYNLDYLFKWREGQNTAVVLAAPNSSGSTSGGNTNSQNTNSGNGGSS